MKKFFSSMSRVSKKLLVVVVGLVVAATMTTAAVADWGPSRPLKAWEGPNTSGFNHVVFNSFTGVPQVGNEPEFYNGQYQGDSGQWYDPLNQLRQGNKVKLRVYIHNNADSSLNASGEGIARNTTVRVELPEGPAKSHQSTAYIGADNAQPQTIFDTMDFSAENGGFFELDYVEGSAVLKGNGPDVPVSDNLVTTGANIGDIRGCFEYAQVIEFEVEVDMPQYQISKSVRPEGAGPGNWQEEILTKQGDVVEWGVEFKNVGQTNLESVKIVDNLPPFVEVVPGSVTLYNGNYPSGYTYPDSAIQANGTQINVDIGNYNPGINAWVVFQTRVMDAPEIECGAHRLDNYAFATPNGYGSINDGAAIVIKNEPCDKPVVRCDLLTADRINRRTFKFTANAFAQDAEIQEYVFQFGDGTSEVVETSDDMAMLRHQYPAAAKGEIDRYDVAVTVEFLVDGEVVEVSSTDCETYVEVAGPNVPPPPPPKPPKPPKPPCVPGKDASCTVLPKTGAASTIGAFFGTGGLVAAVRGWAISRKELADSLLDV